MANVEKFFKRVSADKEIQHKLKTAEKNYMGDKSDREAVAKAVLLPVAEYEGMPFTIDELRDYEEKLKSKADGVELSEGELKAVAGGWFFCVLSGGDGDETLCTLGGESDDGGSCILIGWE